MLQIRRIVSIIILASALLFPASAFASTGNYSGNNNNSGLQAFTQFFSSFSGNNGSSDDLRNVNWREFEEASSWYEKNKNYCPPESNKIWKKWFCY